MIKKLLSYFERSPKLKDPVTKVFTLNGVAYYQFKDISKVKCQRALVVNDWYNELAMRCSRDYLLAHVEAESKILNNPKEINIGTLAQLNQQLKERLDMIYETDIIYKIASVVFFTKDENPYEYDDVQGAEKVKLFKAEVKKKDGWKFFYERLFKGLIGSTNLSEADLKTYMEVGSQITKKHLETISTILSS